MKSTLDQFMMSPDEEITERHVPKRWLHRHLHVDVSEDISRLVVADAKNIWTKMSDPEEVSVKISHDGYLKVWQLGRPVLNDMKKIQHDVLLVDEGQDMNPAMLDVFHRQSSTPRFIVGDPHQQIYLFRGAVNALGQVAADRTYRLTQSFRFCPEVAFAANCCLSGLKSEDRFPLFGGRRRDWLAGKEEQEGRPRVAYLARTNKELLDAAFRLVGADDNDEGGGSPKSGKFAGGISDYKLDDYVDILHLLNGEPNRVRAGSSYKRFRTFDQLKSFARSSDDASLSSKILTVQDYGDGIVGLVEKLKRRCSGGGGGASSSPDFVFSTAHKAKGLEWDDVFVLNDFGSAFFKGRLRQG